MELRQLAARRLLSGAAARRRWLEHYARFDTVEVNATFYRLPTVKAVQGWVEQTPDDFVFAVKMSRYVTHVKRLREPAPSLELFYGRIEPLAGTPKLGPVLCRPSAGRRAARRTRSSCSRRPPRVRVPPSQLVRPEVMTCSANTASRS